LNKKIPINTNYYTLEDVFSSKYVPNEVDLFWVKDRNSFIYQSERNLFQTDLDLNSNSLFINFTLIENRFNLKIEGYFLSPDSNYLLFYNNKEKIFKYSFKADYFVYSVSNQTLEALSNDKKGFTNALFSPDSSKIAFVFNNNIFLKLLESGDEIQVTSNGNQVIKNGINSWIYEVEIFENYNSIWFSPFSSNLLSYFQFNETDVPLYPITYYQAPYNFFLNMRYPKRKKCFFLKSLFNHFI
jgi:dipeptidyl aminopeptidase/acylaminoacyl peptidase